MSAGPDSKVCPNCQGLTSLVEWTRVGGKRCRCPADLIGDGFTRDPIPCPHAEESAPLPPATEAMLALRLTATQLAITRETH